MKKIINGRKYDTDTASMVGEWSDGYPSDFRYEAETLYRKRNGEYFILGEGNAMSRYAESRGASSHSPTAPRASGPRSTSTPTTTSWRSAKSLRTATRTRSYPCAFPPARGRCSTGSRRSPAAPRAR